MKCFGHIKLDSKWHIRNKFEREYFLFPSRLVCLTITYLRAYSSSSISDISDGILIRECQLILDQKTGVQHAEWKMYLSVYSGCHLNSLCIGTLRRFELGL